MIPVRPRQERMGIVGDSSTDCVFGDIAVVSAVIGVDRAGRKQNKQESTVSAGEALLKLYPGTPRNN